jgi:hypothetical protein
MKFLQEALTNISRVSEEPAEDVDGSDVPDEAFTQENPDAQGLTRTVKGAHLVYKRKTEDGSFEELWIYNVTTLRSNMETKKAILSATDIPIGKSQSPDGTQTYVMWTVGNAELIKIVGLPS